MNDYVFDASLISESLIHESNIYIYICAHNIYIYVQKENIPYIPVSCVVHMRGIGCMPVSIYRSSSENPFIQKIVICNSTACLQKIALRYCDQNAQFTKLLPHDNQM